MRGCHRSESRSDRAAADGPCGEGADKSGRLHLEELRAKANGAKGDGAGAGAADAGAGAVPASARLEVQEALLGFAGVGRKVADCVALFSLDQADAIPVDTHVWQIALRDYGARAIAAATAANGTSGATPAKKQKV